MSRALLVLDSRFQRQKAADWCWSLKEGTRVEFKAPQRSGDQNSKMWAMLTEVSVQLKWHGIKLTPGDWKLQFLDALRRAHGEQVRVVPNTDNSGFVNLGTSSSDLSKEEMSDMIELIFKFGAEHGVVFRDHTTETGTGDRTADPEETGEPAGEADHGDAAAGSPVDTTKLSDEDRKWLVAAARMLIPLATPNGDPDIVRNQYGALIKHQTPPSISQLAIGKAVSISKRLVAVCESTEELDLELLAGIAGCTVEDLR